MSFHQINSIIIPSVECLKIFVTKILRIEQNLWKAQNFHPSKLIRYMVVSSMAPLSQSWLHMVRKLKPALEKQTSQLSLVMQQCTGNVWVWLLAASVMYISVVFPIYSHIQYTNIQYYQWSCIASYSYMFNHIINLDVIYGYNLITRHISALYSYICT